MTTECCAFKPPSARPVWLFGEGVVDGDARIDLRSSCVAALFVCALLSPIGRVARAETAGSPECAGSIRLTIAPRGTMLGALLAAHVERTQATAAVAAVEDLFDPRELRAGDSLCIALDPNTSAGPRRLRAPGSMVMRHISAMRHCVATPSSIGSTATR